MLLLSELKVTSKKVRNGIFVILLSLCVYVNLCIHTQTCTHKNTHIHMEVLPTFPYVNIVGKAQVFIPGVLKPGRAL